jgi:hypothetical protein
MLFLVCAADCIGVVLDHLSKHPDRPSPGGPPPEIPVRSKHVSGLNMIEIDIFSRQCLDRVFKRLQRYGSMTCALVEGWGNN